MALRLDLNAPYWTRRHLADCDNIAEAVALRAVVAQLLLMGNDLAIQSENLLPCCERNRPFRATILSIEPGMPITK